MDRPKRYHPVQVTLHWLIALGVLINLYLGIFVFSRRGRGGNFLSGNALENVHILVGITILVLLLFRIIMRFAAKRPADATAGNRFLDILARVPGAAPRVHAACPWNVPERIPGGFRSPLLAVHRLTAYLVAFLVGLHILAAGYHQFIRRDNLLARMWYGAR